MCAARRKGWLTKSVSEALDSFVFLYGILVLPFPRKLALLTYGDIYGYKNVNASLTRLCKKGYIENFKDKKTNFLRVIQEKRYQALGDFVSLKLSHWKRPWDGKWRLLIYDIPEQQRCEREYFRTILKALGFGNIQKSCWASPYDLSSLIYNYAKKRKIAHCLCLYEGKFFAGKEVDDLVRKAWPLDNLQSRYEILRQGVEELRSQVSKKASNELLDDYANIYQGFKALCQEDPFLPKVFLKEWPYEDIEKSILLLSKDVASRLKHSPLRIK